MLSERLKQPLRRGSGPSKEILEIVVFFMKLNGFVGKQVCSGKPRNRKGENSRWDCSLAQLGAKREEATKTATDVFSV